MLELPDNNTGMDRVERRKPDYLLLGKARGRPHNEALQIDRRNEHVCGSAIDFGFQLARRRAVRSVLGHVHIDNPGRPAITLRDMHQFMHQRVPEPVDAVEAKRQNDNRLAVAQPETSPVDLGARQRLDEEEPNAILGEHLGDSPGVLRVGWPVPARHE